jgi:cysteine-rich repeat protein
VVDPGEECDDGNADNSDDCTVFCKLPGCGDGLPHRPTEECDDGNRIDGDGCNSFCRREGAVCGNGVLEYAVRFPEECDDGNTVSGDGCSALCLTEIPVCGDGRRTSPEECDDGNREPGDGCDHNCRIEAADAGDAEAGEAGDADAEAGEAGDADAAEVRDGWECVDPTCDPVPQCGCPAGQKCTLLGGDRSCTPAGLMNEGRACTSEVECAAGLMCIGAVSSDVSACYRFCNADTDCMGAGSRCVVSVGSGGGEVPGVSLCSINCDPITGAGCPSGTACKPWLVEGSYITDCSGEVGSGRTGRECTSDADCAVGFFCISPAFPNCLQYCAYPGGYCEGGYACTRFEPNVRIGSVEIGYCG